MPSSKFRVAKSQARIRYRNQITPPIAMQIHTLVLDPSSITFTPARSSVNTRESPLSDTLQILQFGFHSLAHIRLSHVFGANWSQDPITPYMLSNLCGRKPIERSGVISAARPLELDSVRTPSKLDSYNNERLKRPLNVATFARKPGVRLLTKSARVL
jgi:hypothetical protein